MSEALKAVWRFLDRIGWIIALIFLAIGFSTLNSQGASEQSLLVAQLRTCHRLNIIRAEDNQSHLIDDRFFGDLIVLVRSYPSVPESVRLITDLKGDIATKEWVPLTDCYPAVEHPLTYVAPVPIPFSQQQPPPSALHVGPGD